MVLEIHFSNGNSFIGLFVVLDFTIDRIVGENHTIYVFNFIPIDLLNDSIDLYNGAVLE